VDGRLEGSQLVGEVSGNSSGERGGERRREEGRGGVEGTGYEIIRGMNGVPIGSSVWLVTIARVVW
jgi:hypothetical protein